MSEEKRKERKSCGWGHVSPLSTTRAWRSHDLALPPTLTHSAPSHPSSFHYLPPHSVTSLNLVPGNCCHTVLSRLVNSPSPRFLSSARLPFLPCLYPRAVTGFGVPRMPLPNRWHRGRGSGSGSRVFLYLTGGTRVGVRVRVWVLRWGLKEVSYSNLTRG